jgi:F0F1-type ATP synthase delta subunit
MYVVEPKNNAVDRVSSELALPTAIVSHADVFHLIRELETIGEALTRVVNKENPTAFSEVSQHLKLVAEGNKLNFVNKTDVDRALRFFEHLKQKAPRVHMSFASEPKPEVLIRLVEWFRQNVHPNILLQNGLQPDIAAGCILRTTNKYYDFSFRNRFKEEKTKLAQSLRTVNEQR